MKSHYNTRETLIAKIKNSHDQRSWEDFVRFYENYIHTVISRKGVKYDDVQDVSQKVLLVLWDKLPEFEYRPMECRFRTWMNNVILNVCRNYNRKVSSYSKKLYQAAEEGLSENDTPLIYDQMESDWKKHVTGLALNNIRPDFEGKAIECFELFCQGKSVDEVCETLELKRNSAFVLRKRVLEKLSTEIRRLDEQLS